MQFEIYRAAPNKIAADFVMEHPTAASDSRRQEPTVLRVTHVSAAPEADLDKAVPLMRDLDLGQGWSGDLFKVKGKLWIWTRHPMFDKRKWVRVSFIRPIIAAGMSLPRFSIRCTLRIEQYL